MVFRRNILIFHLGALGDFVLTWPLALALARMHPQSRVIYVTHAQKGALAERALGVESTSIESGWHHLYGDASQLPAAAQKMLGGAQSVYTFVAGPADEWTQNVRRMAGETDICCLDSRPTESARHLSEQLLGQLGTRPAIREAMVQAIRHINTTGLRPARGEAQGRGAAACVAIHPGSGSREKCWAAERFVELGRELGRAGRRVRVLLGDVELERWPASQIDAFAGVGEVHRPTSFVELLKSLEGVSAFVGNDSGPSHLAGILGLPTYCLFGPTNPAVWHPLGPRVQILHEPLETVSVDRVFSWIGQGAG